VRLVKATMPAADRLRGFIGWTITDVTARRDGVVVDLKLPGRSYNPPTRLVIKDVTRVDELVTAPAPEPDWEQLQIDIGDDMYERSRYDEKDIDVEPDREATKGYEPL
jgi:hypothetical protein